MYASRHQSPAQRAQVLAERKQLKLPWHAPPHFGTEPTLYLLTAACYEHRPILAAEARRDEWIDRLLHMEDELDADLRAWVVLPNHYHLLARVALPDYRAWIGRQHNTSATRWNRQDQTPGRQVWYRFSDRAIRSESHYFATLNYLHANPVKHGFAARADAWRWSSLPTYLESIGRDALATWWRDHPVFDYGKGWDD
jgi:putative transposase